MDIEEKQCGVKGVMSEIIPNFLYLGSVYASKDKAFLQKHGIKYILNCALSICKPLEDKEFTTWAIDIKDGPSENIECLFYPCFEFIERCRKEGKKILVHCQQGISRSTTIVFAYLIWSEKLDYMGALTKLKGVRDVINPNMGFTFSLGTFADRILNKEEKLQIYIFI